MYRIEVLEERLKATPTGRQIAAVFEAHIEEVMLLVNHNRQVTVTWHRNHGPEFIGSAVRSGFEHDFRVVQEIDGVTLPQLIRRMAAVLQEAGTPALKKVIGDHFGLALKWSQTCTSLNDVFEEIQRLEVS